MFHSDLLLCLVAALPVYAQERSGQSLATHDLYLSHLSPMVTYMPVSPNSEIQSGWDVTLERHRATRTGASVEVDYFGTTFEVLGNGTDFDYEISNLGDHDIRYFSRNEIGDPVMFGILTGIDFDEHKVQVQNNDSEDSVMEIRGFTLRTQLPQIDGYADAIHMSGAEIHGVSGDSDPAGAWETMDSPSNQSTNTPFASGYREPPVGGFEFPFNSTILSTDQVRERLYFEVPQRTSLVQLYGTVGPDQGEYEVRLLPTETSVKYQDIEFAPQPANQTFTGQQPVDANFQVKYFAWLDPRVSFAMEIELLEEGKRADIHGASFWRFSEENTEIQDWYPRESGRLSGGQIAGIVVGSVAGAVLIGLAIWFLVRRRNRAASSQSPSDKAVDAES